MVGEVDCGKDRQMDEYIEGKIKDILRINRWKDGWKIGGMMGKRRDR